MADDDTEQNAIEAYFQQVVDTLRSFEEQLNDLRAECAVLDAWNSGLMKVALYHEFRFSQWMAQQDPKASKLAEPERDRLAARVAFEVFKSRMPEVTHQGLDGRREEIVDAMLHDAGYAFEVN